MRARASGLSGQTLTAIASARRASASERVSAGNVSVEMRPLASLADMIQPWKTLATRALEPNVFLDPAFALAAAPVLGSDVKAGLVWSPSAELLGLFPVRTESRRYGLPLPVLCAWTHPFAPFGPPLVHQDAAEPTLSAWLDHVTHDASLPALMLMPYLNDDGPFSAILNAVLSRSGRAVASFDRHPRAMLAPTEHRVDYLEHAIAPKQRKELARKSRRLQDLGPVAFTRADGADAVTGTLAEFFRLEAAGWKGRAGTAAADDPRIRQFVTQAVTELAAQDRAMAYRLSIGPETIAACVALRSGQSAWGWKIAYDETYARFSPGAQLLTRLTESLLADITIAEVDSLATPNHPLIDHIWRERLTMSDRLFAVKPAFVPFSLACRLEMMRRLGRSAARTVREQLRRR
jgi:CelD/BcsL family acetyltransferase involved in cellulose biosynthesis